MGPATLALAAWLCASPAAASVGQGSLLAGPNTGILAKLMTPLSPASSRPGDKVVARLIDPVALLGAELEGTVDRADHSVLNISFHTLRLGGRIYPIEAKLMSITSSHGNEGQDDLGQRVRIEGAGGTGIIAYGTTTALDEGAELRLTVWEK